MLGMIWLQVVLIAFNAIFASAEIAVISMNSNKLEKMAEQGDKRAVRLVRLTGQPARFLATIQVAITLSGFLGSAFAAENFSDGLVEKLLALGVTVPRSTLEAASVVVITVVLSYFTLIFGELVPKRIAMRKSERLALGLSGLLSLIAALCRPVVSFLTVSTNGVLRVLGIDPDAEDEEVNEEEIRMLVDVGSEKGIIDHEEKEIIQNVFEFDDLTAGEIVTHRTEITMLWMEETMEQWQHTIEESRHALYPVCEDSADRVIGILNAREYLCLKDRSREHVMQCAVRPAYFVPESVTADVLFRNMKRSRNQMAIVLDEYGGMSGIITLNDLVEQLLGDLGDDELQQETMVLIEEIGTDSWRIHGRAPLEEVAQKLGMELPCEVYDTFNGLIFSALGSVPDDGSCVELQTAGLSIQITEIEEHQVQTAIVKKSLTI